MVERVHVQLGTASRERSTTGACTAVVLDSGQGAFSRPHHEIDNLGRPLGYINSFPNGFNKGPCILIFFKGFQRPTQ